MQAWVILCEITRLEQAMVLSHRTTKHQDRPQSWGEAVEKMSPVSRIFPRKATGAFLRGKGRVFWS